MKILAFDVGGTAIKTARVTAEGGLVGSYAHWRTTFVRENYGSLDCAIRIVAQ